MAFRSSESPSPAELPPPTVSGDQIIESWSHVFGFPVLAIALVLVLVQLPVMQNLKAYALTNQDFNPVHFARLFLSHDIPESDDCEVGPRRDLFVFSTAYFWLPLIGHGLGLPLETTIFLHGLFGPALFFLAMYLLSVSIFHDREAAIFSSLAFFLGRFAWFRLNIGYPLLLLESYYYNDLNHIFVIGALTMLVRGNSGMAVGITSALVFFNPTYAINLAVPVFLFSILQSGWNSNRKKILLHLSLFSMAVGLDYLLLSGIRPDFHPAPVAARNLAIMTYGHIAPHARFIGLFLTAHVILLGSLCFAHFCPQPQGAETVGNRRTSIQAVLISHVWMLLLYVLLFSFSPSLFVMISPSKMLMISAIFTWVFVGQAVFMFLTIGGFRRWISLLAIALATFSLAGSHHRMFLLVLLGIFGGRMIDRFCSFPENSRPQGARPAHILLLAILPLIGVLLETRWLKAGCFEVPQSFLQVQEWIRAQTPPNALFVPYRAKTITRNPFGIGGNFPFRTYSRRGTVAFGMGRNVYFDSLRRHLNEDFLLRASGEPGWDDLLEKMNQALKEDSLQFLWGISCHPDQNLFGPSGALQLFSDTVERSRTRLNALDLPMFDAFARLVGATHILVCKDPWIEPPPACIYSNDFFAVLPVSQPSGQVPAETTNSRKGKIE